MKAAALERLLWRYEYGRLAHARLELEFADAMRHLNDARAVQGVPAAIERWNAGELLSARDLAPRLASAKVRRGDFRAAMPEIRSALAALEAVDELLAADAQVAAARDLSLQVASLAASATLQHLPAVLSLLQLVENLDLKMFGAAYGLARHLAATCVRMATALISRGSAMHTDRVEFDGRLTAAAETCLSTNAFAPDSERDPLRDGTFTRLAWLLENGYDVLAVRLLTELEITLAPRRRFHLHFRSVCGTRTPAVKELVRLHSWDGAVDHDRQSAIAAHSAVLRSLAERAQSAAANLDASLS